MVGIPGKHIRSVDIKALSSAVLHDLAIYSAQHPAIRGPTRADTAIVVVHYILLQFRVDQLEMLARRAGRLNRRQQALAGAASQTRNLAVGQCPSVNLHLVDTAAKPIRGLPCRCPTTDTHRLVAGHNGTGNRQRTIQRTVDEKLHRCAIIGHRNMVLATGCPGSITHERMQACGRPDRKPEMAIVKGQLILAPACIFTVLGNNIASRRRWLNEGADGERRRRIQRQRILNHNITCAVEVQACVHMTGSKGRSAVDGARVAIARHVVGDNANALIEGPVTGQTIIQAGVCCTRHGEWQQGCREET